MFVLGAGASAPYGFPLGPLLAERVCRSIEQRHTGLHQLLCGHFDAQAVDAFPQEFRRSGQYSLDSFVERRPEFREIVKTAIIYTLAPSENEPALLAPPRTNTNDVPVGTPDGIDRDWYRYLLRQIVTTRPEDFGANRLKVITFNFDRSFERRLFVSLKSTYNLSDVETEKLTQAVPILHIHGDLGAPAWLPSCAEDPEGRPYHADKFETIATTHARRLSLIDDEIPNERRSSAREWLIGAKVVCFLGFSYHPLNLARLHIGSLSEPTIRGTARSMSTGEIGAVRREFHNKANVSFFPNYDSLLFLRETEYVHQ